jgi:D-glycero-D-manno-heptose 1,7-bisphosphate phosphatase
MTARALFLDRDGVINVDHGYVHRPEHFQLVPGIVDLLRFAQESGFMLVVVTNQSGLARGMFDSRRYAEIEQHMLRLLRDHGIVLTAVYHCPHHPEGSVPELAIACDCRKPAPGLIVRAAVEQGIDLKRSILVGDKESDLKAADAAGIGKSFLVDPGAPAVAFARARAALKQS